ncbi:MAG: BON domain-containing protein [Ignavibacteriaceae bacterium]
MKPNIKNILRDALYLLLGIGLFASLTFAQNSKKQSSKSTLKIFVEYRLAKERLLNDGNINVSINGNKIILSGTEPTIYDKNQAEQVTQDVNENYLVVNNIKVASPNVPDSVIVKNVQKRIYNNVFYGIFDWVTVHYNNGIVTLKGWVHLPWYKSQFQREAEKVAGVKGVKNEIQNTFGPGSVGIRAARLIYNDPMFEGMEYSANPPVHIIVNNGTVLLEGRVTSNAQSSWASNLVRFYTGAITIENNLNIIKG